MKTKEQLIDELLDLAFAEDIGDGDHTTLSTIPAEACGKSRLLIKEEGILSGVNVARRVLEKIDPELKMETFIEDGAHVVPGDVAFTVEGSVRSLLIAERTMLNIMQRMSGVATMTARYQKRLEGLHTRVLDTRKTTPGMRMLEKEAVKTGGGTNHRIGLFDMILIKDNHIDFAGGIENAVKAAQDYCKANGKDLKIEVEVRSLDDIRRVLAIGGVDRIMFDNFTPELTREAVKLVDGKCETESSGGITIENLRDYGEAGVDFISVGALTHSVKGLDMSFKAVTK
ncbi:MAG: carboxylating nicotinate-nucleotide diphosphorylase [Muribaculaceae bacterium]|nr:carboxylating nicotinate-nucleotide diphosphorylase [Muribaculaceae bacterium]